jgi:hypothetical protein
MFKRLLFLSFIIALLLTCVVIWFWYIPQEELKKQRTEKLMNQSNSDTVSIKETVKPLE